jgi:hypothetical protein
MFWKTILLWEHGLDGKPFSSGGSSSFYYISAANRLHPFAKSVRSCSPFFLGLVGALWHTWDIILFWLLLSQQEKPKI